MIAPVVTTPLTDEPGVYLDVPMKDYLALDAVSSSILRGLESTCPAEVRYDRLNPLPSTPTQLRGTLFALMTERRSIDCPEIVRIEGRINSPGVAERVARAEEEGRIVLRLKPEQEAYDEAVAMYEAVRAEPRFAPYLADDCLREATLVWRDETTGRTCKARPDVIRHGVDMADWKTAANVHNWPRVVQDSNYHMQAAWHLAGAKALGLLPPTATYHWLVIRNKAPFATAGVKTCGDLFLAIGEELTAAHLLRWDRCLQSGEFPTYPDETCAPQGWYAQLYNPEE